MLLALLTALALPQEPVSFPTGSDPAAIYGERWTPEARVFASVGPSVVSIDVEAPLRTIFQRGALRKQKVSQGTGVVIDASGLVITNAHVAKPPEIRIDQSDMTFWVSFSDEFGGGVYPAQLLSLDRESDLALLKISERKAFTPVPMGLSSDLLVGEPVIAIGTPYGNSHSITSGILSGRHRNVTVDTGRGARLFTDLLQTDAAINPGNSGGPLLNVHGELIGINSATNRAADGIGFAIPVDKVKEVFAERLLNVDRSDRFWAGMSVSEIDNGLAITSVHPRGPAHAAGLQPGDYVREIDGEPVESLHDYAALLLNHQAGEYVTLKVDRSNREKESKVRLSPARDRDFFGLLGFEARPEYVVLRVDGKLKELKVLRVLNVYRGTGAEALGLQTGDYLLAARTKAHEGGVDAGWRPIQGLGELIALLRSPEFERDSENIWLLRGDRGFQGQLVLDDPTVGLSG